MSLLTPMALNQMSGFVFPEIVQKLLDQSEASKHPEAGTSPPPQKRALYYSRLFVVVSKCRNCLIVLIIHRS